MKAQASRLVVVGLHVVEEDHGINLNPSPSRREAEADLPDKTVKHSSGCSTTRRPGLASFVDLPSTRCVHPLLIKLGSSIDDDEDDLDADRTTSAARGGRPRRGVDHGAGRLKAGAPPFPV